MARPRCVAREPCLGRVRILGALSTCLRAAGRSVVPVLRSPTRRPWAFVVGAGKLVVSDHGCVPACCARLHLSLSRVGRIIRVALRPMCASGFTMCRYTWRKPKAQCTPASCCGAWPATGACRTCGSISPRIMVNVRGSTASARTSHANARVRWLSAPGGGTLNAAVATFASRWPRGRLYSSRRRAPSPRCSSRRAGCSVTRSRRCGSPLFMMTAGRIVGGAKATGRAASRSTRRGRAAQPRCSASGALGRMRSLKPRHGYPQGIPACLCSISTTGRHRSSSTRHSAHGGRRLSVMGPTPSYSALNSVRSTAQRRGEQPLAVFAPPYARRTHASVDEQSWSSDRR